MKDSSGTYTLVSYNEAFQCDAQFAISTNIDSSWPGTLLILEWNIHNELDSLSVYNNWKPMEGYNIDDFF